MVEAVDGIKSGVGDGDSVMLGKLALCEDAVKELSASGELKKRCNIGREADDVGVDICPDTGFVSLSGSTGKKPSLPYQERNGTAPRRILERSGYLIKIAEI